MLFASRLTTTTRVSSEVSAMVLERVGAAPASFGTIIAERSVAAAMASAAPPPITLSQVRDCEFCEFFMNGFPETPFDPLNRGLTHTAFCSSHSPSVIRTFPLAASGKSLTERVFWHAACRKGYRLRIGGPGAWVDRGHLCGTTVCNGLRYGLASQPLTIA